MLLRFLLVVSDIPNTKSKGRPKSTNIEKHFLKVPRGIYLRMKKNLRRTDKRYNKGKRKKIMTYPIFVKKSKRGEKQSYVVYSAIKQYLIQDIIPIDLEKLLKK